MTSLPTFKIVGDNIDKTVRPRQETSDSHTKSLHYFHSYAVKDRVGVTMLTFVFNGHFVDRLILLAYTIKDNYLI